MATEICIDCGGTIPADDVENASTAWIINKGSGLVCRACDERERREYEEMWASLEPQPFS